MNPANGNSRADNFNGAGNAYPMFGTGNSVYAQVGLKLRDSLLGTNGTLMPYASYRYSRYDRLSDPVAVYNFGVNWLIIKHQNKVSLNYELRPLFTTGQGGALTRTGSAGSAWLQYQIFM
jgi:hypothetical protein